MTKRTLLLPFFCLLCFASALQAEVKLANIFSNNMVLQRDKPIKMCIRDRNNIFRRQEYYNFYIYLTYYYLLY